MVRFVPSNNVFLCKYGNSDVVFDIVLGFVMVSTTLGTIYFKENYLVVNLLNYLFMGLLCAAYYVNYYFTPFYNTAQHNLKSFQILYLINLTIFSALVRETKFALIQTEVSTLILMILSLSFFVKANNNLSLVDYGIIFRELKDPKNYSERKVMKMYYLLMNHINGRIKGQVSASMDTFDNEEISIFIQFMDDNHRKSCKKLHCFCNHSKVFRNNHALGIFDPKLGSTEIV